MDQFNLPKQEEKILEFWKKNGIFEKSLALRRHGKKFVFYEGPPYANGKPGIHHVLARIYKDIILRYKTMRGYFVPRKAGWDTHGLPVEMAAEKALGLKSKKDIEKFGVKRFNEEAKKAVWLYKDEWERMTERIGYWLDLKNAYVTYEPEYIETVWWTMAQISKRRAKSRGEKNGLLYKGHKVVPWCTRCGTALSSHELALGYKETEDASLYVKFKLKSGQTIRGLRIDGQTFILSWTTTPWTLPGNVALAAGRNINYAAVRIDGVEETYILAKDLIKSVFKEKPVTVVLADLKGKDLVGLNYEPLFNVKPLKSENSYKVYAADFVTISDGTGIVHTAVMYGEDDYRLGEKVGLPQKHTVGEDGRFIKDVSGLAELYAKDGKTENLIIEKLRNENLLLKTELYVHEYPHCWRCETPVLYYARTSWFIAMSKLRDKLVAANKKINWIPQHIKEGRFGEWLREAKDWNISRERYWGAPLPIWECKDCKETDVVGSLDELAAHAGGARNNYWLVRHGQGENNTKKLINSAELAGFNLTEEGKKQALSAARKLAREKIHIIIASDVERTKQTAGIIGGILGIKPVFDKRIREVFLGKKMEGCHDDLYHELFPTYESKFENRPEGGESLRDLRRRMWEFFEATEKKYKNKNILLVSHEYPIWMLMHAACGWSEKRAIAEKKKRGKDFVVFAAPEKLNFRNVPRDETGLIDLHRPYVDEIVWQCRKCGGKMRRVKEVADVWYDSGAMPFAQSHWPLEGSGVKNKLPIAYPADYIAEGMDQTRGWFYTLLAIAMALGYEAPYKNVVSLGLINDKFGQKMSKSKGNVVDPWAVIGKYGADAVRWYFFTVNPPGETKNFDESEVLKSYRKMHLLLWNSFLFYKTYAKRNSKLKISAHGETRRERQGLKLRNVLDLWVLARLEETAANVTKNLDKYEIRDAALEIERFIDDLSRWFIRRSRRRLQRPESKDDYDSASSTLGFILLSVSKFLAPFTPFFSEILWQALGNSKSVHMENWPVREAWGKPKENSKLLKQMEEVRRLASLALASRAEEKIKVRQPLSRLKVKSSKSKIDRNLLEILAEEVNVKEIVSDAKLKNDIELDIAITPELKEEGILRDIARALQELRQKAGLRPKDKIAAILELPDVFRVIVERNEKIIKSDVGAASIEYKKNKFDAEEIIKIEGNNCWLAVRKI